MSLVNKSFGPVICYKLDKIINKWILRYPKHGALSLPISDNKYHNGKFRNKNETLRVSITNIISQIKMLNYRITRLLILMPLDSPDLKYGHVFINHPELKQSQEKS